MAGAQTPPPATREIYTPTRLNLEARALLEGTFPLLWIEGEISNLARPSSGHIYFSLKDARAQVRCAMFRGRNRLLRFRPENGAQVLLRARVSLYEGRGEFQLIAESMEEAGHGALQRAYEELAARLAAEGLFAAERKRQLPALPTRVGVITSPSGAALRDVLHVLARRFPGLPAVLYPATVQGNEAPAALRAALAAAVRRAECDVLILTRGGGSLEDLWAFNDEALVRDLAACPIPVVSGVGHETDVTLVDLVADLRAPTPSAAAEAVSPDGLALAGRFAEQAARLSGLVRRSVGTHREHLAWLRRRLELRHPAQQLAERAQRLDGLERRLGAGWQRRAERLTARLALAEQSLARHHPGPALAARRATLVALRHRLGTALRHGLDDRARALAATARGLDLVSPLATLGRGYAIVTSADGAILRRADDVAPGTRVQARLGHGGLDCVVERVVPAEEDDG